ncbi:hypothetical protein ACJX0J_016662, partial [Zea mays]
LAPAKGRASGLDFYSGSCLATVEWLASLPPLLPLLFTRLGSLLCLKSGTVCATLIIIIMLKPSNKHGKLRTAKFVAWSEWFYNKVMSNLLYYYGMCNVVNDILLQRYFGKGVRGGSAEPESDIVQACRSFLDQRQCINVWRFIQTINERKDLTENLKQLQCRTLIFVGENSQFHAEAVHMTAKLDRRYSALVEGFLHTKFGYFLMGYGLQEGEEIIRGYEIMCLQIMSLDLSFFLPNQTEYLYIVIICCLVDIHLLFMIHCGTNLCMWLI